MTGATSGIGEVAAERLAGMGARIVFIARDRTRASVTLARLKAAGSSVAHSVHYADLSRLSEMKRVAAEIVQEEPRIDVLVNNAGAIFSDRHVTEDGLERTFALNHMAYFIITLALRERLLASAPARIINTASGIHQSHMLDLDDLQLERGYSALKAYGRSKLCNILFTRELARRMKGTGVTANCFHPGFVATRFADEAGGIIGRFVGLAKLFAIKPHEGAETLVYLASSPKVANITGEYFYKCRIARPSPAAQDCRIAALLWEKSAKIAHLDA
jgi:NAD(P)-dependent dehydrogenase (short-subunit alcohol dehydrogenase family)